MDDAYERRAETRRRTMTSQLAHSKEHAEQLALERTDGLTPNQRAEAIWDLVCELEALRGTSAAELRFDRSVARLERRRR